jgi:DNA-binding LytR/AlgR family response regulator
MPDLWRLLGGHPKFLREGDKLSNDLPCAPQAIEWTESKANYVVLHTAGAQYTLRMTMAAAEERLKSTDIIRIHRRCMVNRSKIKQVLQDAGGEFVVTVTGQLLRIGHAFRKVLFDATVEHLHGIQNLLTPAFT